MSGGFQSQKRQKKFRKSRGMRHRLNLISALSEPSLQAGWPFAIVPACAPFSAPRPLRMAPVCAGVNVTHLATNCTENMAHAA